MGAPKKPTQTGKRNAKKRSMVERVIVWIGILTLLFVVLMEWTSQLNYGKTLEDFESALKAKSSNPAELGPAADEISRHVHGFAFQGELLKGITCQRTLQWPSLFKFYKIGLSFDSQNRVRNVETFLAAAEPTNLANDKPLVYVEKPDPVDNPPTPSVGFPEETVSAFALLTNDPPSPYYVALAGSLSREIVRQGFLIAGREELGLVTLRA